MPDAVDNKIKEYSNKIFNKAKQILSESQDSIGELNQFLDALIEINETNNITAASNTLDNLFGAEINADNEEKKQEIEDAWPPLDKIKEENINLAGELSNYISSTNTFIRFLVQKNQDQDLVKTIDSILSYVNEDNDDILVLFGTLDSQLKDHRNQIEELLQKIQGLTNKQVKDKKYTQKSFDLESVSNAKKYFNIFKQINDNLGQMQEYIQNNPDVSKELDKAQEYLIKMLPNHIVEIENRFKISKDARDVVNAIQDSMHADIINKTDNFSKDLQLYDNISEELKDKDDDYFNRMITIAVSDSWERNKNYINSQDTKAIEVFVKNAATPIISAIKHSQRSKDSNYDTVVILHELVQEIANNKTVRVDTSHTLHNVAKKDVGDIKKAAEKFQQYSSSDLYKINREIARLNKNKDILEANSHDNTLEVIRQNTEQAIKERQDLRSLIIDNIHAEEVLFVSPPEDDSFVSEFIPEIIKRKDINTGRSDDLTAIANASRGARQKFKAEQAQRHEIGQEDLSSYIAINLKHSKNPEQDDVVLYKRISNKASANSSDNPITISYEKNIIRNLTDPEKKKKLTPLEQHETAFFMALKAMEKFAKYPDKPFIIKGDPQEAQLMHAALVYLMCDENGKVLDCFKERVKSIENLSIPVLKAKEGSLLSGNYQGWISNNMGIKADELNNKYNDVRQQLHHNILDSEEQRRLTTMGMKKEFKVIREHKVRSENIEDLDVTGSNKTP